MKNTITLFLLFTFLFSSCIDYKIYEEPANVILENYGGELEYGPGVGVGAGSKGAKYDYLSVELSNSPFLQFGISPKSVMTHIAIELAKVAPENISEIQVELSSIPSENGNKDFAETISMKEAKLIIAKEEILHMCFDKIALNNIEEVIPLLTEEHKLSFKKNGALAIKGINDFVGDYKGSMFRGYELVRNDSNPDKDFILLHGLILGSKQNADVRVIIDPEKPDNQNIVALRF